MVGSSSVVIETPGALEAALTALAGRRIVALTGAGLSTDSGIPDYRSPGSPARKPMTYQQFLRDPAYRRTYWARNQVGWRRVAATRPNDGHLALVAMERAAVITGVITQNVDRLHTVAGSREVIELHGTYARVVCLDCGAVVSRSSLGRRLDDHNPDPVAVPDIEIAPDADAVVVSTEGFRVVDCDRCGGILKPDIVFFGENVPKQRVAAAYQLLDAADALLVAGSSLTVMSGYRFVRHAAATGRPVVIVNRGATRGDPQATVKVDAGCSSTLAELARRLAA